MVKLFLDPLVDKEGLTTIEDRVKEIVPDEIPLDFWIVIASIILVTAIIYLYGKIKAKPKKELEDYKKALEEIVSLEKGNVEKSIPTLEAEAALKSGEELKDTLQDIVNRSMVNLELEKEKAVKIANEVLKKWKKE